MYKDDKFIHKVKNEYDNSINRFKIIQNTHLEEPLKIDIDISGNLLRYIEAFYNLSEKVRDITIKSVMDFLQLSVGGVSAFFNRHASLLKLFITGIHEHPVFATSYENKYVLTDQGKIYIELIHLFRDFYKSLQNP
ncbi:MAG: hypothetical protein EU533_08850 [Promethearchaeota archaeon]|nr:MAG: hypothetical protein EU533_08850 [Candidatus Lokiarchaeota archaeon]